MAGNKKQKRSKKSKSTTKAAPSGPPKRRMSFAQIAFVAFGVLIILSMVISLVANFLAY